MVAKLALWAWAPIVLIIFSFLRPARRAALVAYLGAYMFLPMDSLRLNAFLELSKISVAGISTLLGMLLFDTRTILRFRPKWYDIPMFVWCFTPYLTSMVNGLGAVDGFSSVSQQVITWGIPYFIGRCYFVDWESFREFGIAIIIGGIIYVPLCLLEVRVSPILHKTLYGKYAHAIMQEKRGENSYRPQVFMFSGLAVAMWMTTASVVAVWMWFTGAVKKIWNIPLLWILPFLIFTALLCRSGAAMAFLFVGLASLVWIKYLRNPLPLLILLLIPPTYMFERASQTWDGTWMKEQAYSMYGEERGKSFATRIDAENQLTDRAFDAPNPWFGWGKWDPNRPGATPWRIQTERILHTSLGEEYVRLLDMAPTDGLWVISLGQFGIVGLVSLTVTVLLPVVLMFMKVPMRLWGHPIAGAAAAMSIMVALHMSDNLLNGIPNPFFQMAAGGICGLTPSLRKLYKQQQAQGLTTVPNRVAAAPAAMMSPAANRPTAPQPIAEGFPGISGLRAPSAPFRR